MGIGGQKKITSAKGEIVDFDLLMIKQQLAAAPQNVEVARRQKFIDSKEQGKSTRKPKVVAENQPLPPAAPVVNAADEFENDNGDIPAGLSGSVEPIPVIDR
jgi:hypothetical protein